MSQDDALIRRLESQLAREKARADLLERQAEHLLHENRSLRAENAELRTELASLKTTYAKLQVSYSDLQKAHDALLAKVEHLGEYAKQCLRRLYGPRSERRRFHEDGQQTLDVIAEHLADLAAIEGEDGGDERAGDDTDDTLAEHGVGNEDSADETTSDRPPTPETTNEKKSKKRKRPANAGGRHGKPVGLDEVRQVYEPPPDHPELRNARDVAIIGTADIWDLDGGHCAPFIRVTECPIARIVLPDGSVTTVKLTPPKIIPRGGCSDRLLISSAVDKTADFLPTYRQSKRFDRLGLELPRSKLARWHIRLAEFLSALAGAILEETLQCQVLGVDDSVHRLLEGSEGGAKQSRLWIVQAQKNSFYLFSETREAKWLLNMLDDYSGAVMGDAYIANEKLFKREDIVPLLCWAHVRRKFFEAADRRRASIMLDLIGQLYDIEKAIADCPATQRQFRRHGEAKPILTTIKRQLDDWDADPAILPQSGIGKAVTYAHKRWDWLTNYCDTPLAAIDNNAAERGMRPNALHRKNSLFSATIKGAQSYAILSTVIHTAINHGLNPEAYLNDIADDIHYGRRPIHDLTPAAYVARMKSGCEKRS